MNTQRLISGLLVVTALLLPATRLQAAFDPVNDDTDIFLVNPNVDASRPNILLVLDNTANWSRNVGGDAIFINEKSALNTVIAGLTELFNVGVMMFPETGSGWNSVDGGYVRYAVRQMTTTNKSILSTIVSGLDRNGDKGNNNTVSLAMLEAFRYFAGRANRASYGKLKSDYDGNSTYAGAPYNSGLGSYALAASPDDTTLYNTPISDGCQKNFIIMISNGGANENASALRVSEDELATLTGVTPPATLEISPNGQQSNWADEWARYMANADVNSSIAGDQHVYTYSVEVDPGSTGQGPSMTALMKSIAANGKGKYFAVTSLNGGQSIVNALNQIFQEIQAVNSVFASTTLPVSVNVRGTNLNQVYIGVFRPDSLKQPRWYGNLKCYKLGYNDATDSLFLADALGNEAENTTSGFINATSPSFWTESSSYWGFRTADENGSGGASDLPDGDLVEKGGVAQHLRIDHAATHANRKFYTCTDFSTTTLGSSPCTTNSLLSDYKFDTTNTDINSTSLLLSANEVSLLNAEEVHSISEVRDIREISSLTTGGNVVDVTRLYTLGATDYAVSSLSTTQSVTLSGLNNGAVERSVTLQYAAPNRKKIAKAIVSGAAHGFTVGTTITIANASAAYNGTHLISAVSTADNSFEFDPPGNNNLPAGTVSGQVTTSTTSVTATTSANHGFSPGQMVTISGVSSPAGFNGQFQMTTASGNTFTFSTPTPLGAVTLGVSPTASSYTNTATATTSGHTLTVGRIVAMTGATPAGYNGSVTITAVNGNDFSYQVAAPLAPATGTITATYDAFIRSYIDTDGDHNFSSGDQVTISGASLSGYNGTFSITYMDDNTFYYDPDEALAPIDSPVGVTATGGLSNTARAISTGHGFADGATVTVAGATPSDYNGDHTITVVDDDTFTFDLLTTPAAATGTITARLTTATAHVTSVGHGLSTGDSVTVRAASPDGFNREDVAVTVIDSDQFTYPLSSSVEAVDSSGSAEWMVPGTRAVARAPNHGFVNGDSVTISGASPAQFNTTFTLGTSSGVIDIDSFWYTITPAAEVASGTIFAELSGGGGGSSAEVTSIVNWVRGEDNYEDEDSDTTRTDARASIHGDVLHARPAVINYNRFGDDNDVFIFYGANDGVFHAVKGGFDSAVGQPDPGAEAWGFVPPEFFGKLRRLRYNEPIISSSNKKPYFADGSLGTYVVDANNDGSLLRADGDKAYIYLSMRRGGRLIYALDVTDPLAPRMLWQRDSGDAGFEELGQTWSTPKVVTDLAASADPVLIFGAGYDDLVEDQPPDQISSQSSASVTTTSGSTLVRSMGRGILAVNALTGNLIWRAGPASTAPAAGASYDFLAVSGMDYAIPGEITVLRSRDSSRTDRAYVGDTGGNIWRVDLAAADPANWKVSQFASVADFSAPAGYRKFFYPPDVVYDEGYDGLLIGSGDREHPFDTLVNNRMYMFKDKATGASAFDAGGSPLYSVITESDLFDATNNCIQDGDACTGGSSPADAMDDLDAADGWVIGLAGGEKVISNAVTLNRVTFFNTNQPGAAAAAGTCASDLGIARQYQVNFDDATAVDDRNEDSETDAGDRAQSQPGGGYLPSPVPVVVEIDGQIHEAVISGVRVDEPPGSQIGSRFRRFWYKEFDG